MALLFQLILSTMPIIEQLASQQNQKGNNANIALANEIASSNNKGAIRELVENLGNKDIVC